MRAVSVLEGEGVGTAWLVYPAGWLSGRRPPRAHTDLGGVPAQDTAGTKGPAVSGKQDQLGEQPPELRAQPPLLEPRVGRAQDEELWGQHGSPGLAAVAQAPLPSRKNLWEDLETLEIRNSTN